jgi:hypothetical protein
VSHDRRRSLADAEVELGRRLERIEEIGEDAVAHKHKDLSPRRARALPGTAEVLSCGCGCGCVFVCLGCVCVRVCVCVCVFGVRVCVCVCAWRLLSGGIRSPVLEWHC